MPTEIEFLKSAVNVLGKEKVVEIFFSHYEVFKEIWTLFESNDGLNMQLTIGKAMVNEFIMNSPKFMPLETFKEANKEMNFELLGRDALEGFHTLARTRKLKELPKTKENRLKLFGEYLTAYERRELWE